MKYIEVLDIKLYFGKEFDINSYPGPGMYRLEFIYDKPKKKEEVRLNFCYVVVYTKNGDIAPMVWFLQHDTELATVDSIVKTETVVKDAPVVEEEQTPSQDTVPQEFALEMLRITQRGSNQ